MFILFHDICKELFKLVSLDQEYIKKISRLRMWLVVFLPLGHLEAYEFYDTTKSKDV